MILPGVTRICTQAGGMHYGVWQRALTAVYAHPITSPYQNSPCMHPDAWKSKPIMLKTLRMKAVRGEPLTPIEVTQHDEERLHLTHPTGVSCELKETASFAILMVRDCASRYSTCHVWISGGLVERNEQNSRPGIVLTTNY